jgi:hypothetical protein
LAAHLIDAHGLAAPEAVERARQVFKKAAMDRRVTKRTAGGPHEPAQAEASEKTEARVMSPATRKPRPCTACGQRGHRSDSKECPKKSARTVRAGSRNSQRPALQDAIKTLRAERAELDAAIAALERIGSRR